MRPQDLSDVQPPAEPTPVSGQDKVRAAVGLPPKPGPVGDLLDVIVTDTGNYRIRKMWWVPIKVQGRVTHFTFAFKPKPLDLINAVQISGQHYKWADWLIRMFLHELTQGRYEIQEGKILDKEGE